MSLGFFLLRVHALRPTASRRSQPWLATLWGSVVTGPGAHALASRDVRMRVALSSAAGGAHGGATLLARQLSTVPPWNAAALGAPPSLAVAGEYQVTTLHVAARNDCVVQVLHAALGRRVVLRGFARAPASLLATATADGRLLLAVATLARDVLTWVVDAGPAADGSAALAASAGAPLPALPDLDHVPVVLAWADAGAGVLAAAHGATLRRLALLAPAAAEPLPAVELAAAAHDPVVALAFSPRAAGAEAPAAGVTGGDGHALCAVGLASGTVMCGQRAAGEGGGLIRAHAPTRPSLVPACTTRRWPARARCTPGSRTAPAPP